MGMKSLGFHISKLVYFLTNLFLTKELYLGIVFLPSLFRLTVQMWFCLMLGPLGVSGEALALFLAGDASFC